MRGVRGETSLKAATGRRETGRGEEVARVGRAKAPELKEDSTFAEDVKRKRDEAGPQAGRKATAPRDSSTLRCILSAIYEM